MSHPHSAMAIVAGQPARNCQEKLKYSATTVSRLPATPRQDARMDMRLPYKIRITQEILPLLLGVSLLLLPGCQSRTDGDESEPGQTGQPAIARRADPRGMLLWPQPEERSDKQDAEATTENESEKE